MSIHSLSAKEYKRKLRPSIDENQAFDYALKFAKICRNLGMSVTLAFLNRKNLDIIEVEKLCLELDCKYDIREFE